jgi:chromosome segregation and condensation protein ScpB
MFYEKYYAPVEALLFASGEPITAERIAKVLRIPSEHVDDIIFDLK